jgi:vancomycin resistance protein YoaR
MVLATLLVGGVLVGGAGLDRAYQNRILPGVRYGDLSLSGLSESQVKGLIDVHAQALLSAPVVFTYGEREWRPPAPDVGLAIDAPAMAQDALGLQRDVPGLLRLPQALYLGAVRPEVSLRARRDERQLLAYLHALALELDRPPANAGLQVKGGELVVGAASPGQRLDVAETAKRVQPPTTLAGPQRVELVVTSVPPAVGDASVAEAQAVARRVLSGPLTIKGPTRSWTLSVADLGNMLDIKPAGPNAPPVDATAGEGASVAAGGEERLVASLNEAKVAAYVRTLASQTDRPPVDAELRWNGSSVAIARESRDGLRVEQPDAVRAIISQAGQPDQREVTLKTAVSKPQVSSENLPALNIQRPIATGTSRFAGSSPERINNIKVAAGRLNGVIIAPGQTFSFLAALGPITKANGYQEGLTIQGDATVPGIGGGVCQVSTTAFRAAFFAGLPIVERHQHTYRVSYYEQDGSPTGFDAAVYSPGVDLKFRNDTGGAILIQTAVDTASSTLTFRFFGSPTGREVKLTPSRTNEVKAGPRLPDGSDATLPKGQRKQVEWAADGADATIGRTVLQDGQVTATDSFFSRYAPWRDKWVVGTGGAPAAPAATGAPAPTAGATPRPG